MYPVGSLIRLVVWTSVVVDTVIGLQLKRTFLFLHFSGQTGNPLKLNGQRCQPKINKAEQLQSRIVYRYQGETWRGFTINERGDHHQRTDEITSAHQPQDTENYSRSWNNIIRDLNQTDWKWWDRWCSVTIQQLPANNRRQQRHRRIFAWSEFGNDAYLVVARTGWFSGRVYHGRWHQESAAVARKPSTEEQEKQSYNLTTKSSCL